MSEPPAPSWPVAAPDDDAHRRPAVVVVATAIGLVWSLVVLVLAVRFGLRPSAAGWRHADPTGLLPHGRWWRIGTAVVYVAWCGLGVWFAVAAYRRQTWAAVALAVSALLAFVVSAPALRTVTDLPVPLGALTSLLLIGLPASRAWYSTPREA